MGAILHTTLPADLTRPLKSDGRWVSELVQCQALLKDKYRRSALVKRSFVGDDVERVTMVQIKPRKSKPRGSET